MIKYFALVCVLFAALALTIPGKPVATVGPFQVDTRHSDAQFMTDATTNYGKTKIKFAVGIARVSGTVNLDTDNPAKSTFDFSMYPSTSQAPAIGEDGKLKAQWLADLANHTLVCFHSKGASATPDGRLRTSGYLVLTRVDRNVEFNPSEAYSGPVYGPPMVHRITHDATFVFDTPTAANGNGKKNDAKGQEMLTSGSTSMAREDFPQLLRAVMSTYWPPIVQDENCQWPSNVGEDFSGPHCTGSFVDTPRLPVEPRDAGVGEDYPPRSDFNSVVGEHLTISVHLHLLPTASGQQADARN